MSDNKGVKIAAIGCGALLLIFGCVGIFGTAGYFMLGTYAGSDSEQALHVKAFLADVRDGNRQDAYHRMSHRYQASHDFAAFESRLDAATTLAGHREDTVLLSIDNTDESAGESTLVTGTVSGADGDSNFQVTLVEKGAYWYLDNVAVGEQTLE